MTKTIEFTNVNPISSKDTSLIKNEIKKTINNNDFILGQSVKKFEDSFSKLSKIRYSVGCASGTDALILALKSLNLKKGDEVIVPGLTYISTGLSVLLNNNNLIFSDVDNKTGLISIEKTVQKINKKTKAMIAVNLYGQKVDLKKLRLRIGKKISIIEDAAQSHFAYSCYNCSGYSKNKCCKKEKNDSYADISCYSFYPSKNIGAYGDGGLVATNNKKLYKKLLALRNLGSIKKHEYTLIGLNSRLDTLQAAVLKQKLKSILKLNECRRKIAKIYDNNLNKIKEIDLTKTKPGSTRHLYVIRTKKRDLLQRYLKSKKIYCQIHYPYSLNKLKPFKKHIKNINLRNSEQWSKECISLPMHPNLQINQVYRVVYEIMKYFKYR